MNKNLAALCLAWLIVMLPIVHAQELNETTTEQALFVKSEIPRYPRTTKLDIGGTTKPGALVEVIVNGNSQRKDTIGDGTFLFKNIQLVKGNNTVTLKAELAGEAVQQAYQADVDTEPPLFNVTMPAVVTAATATAKVKVSEAVNLTVKVGNETAKSQNIPSGATDVSVALKEGENFVEFTAEDKAGFKSITEERIVYDTGPPHFVNTNLNQLSPTYRQEIEVKGKVSEQASVTAFVNGKAQKTEATAADGTFSIKIKLERPLSISATGKATVGFETSVQWANKVRLEAIDAAGLKESTEEVEIQYSLCGSGTWVDVQLTAPMPDTLNPRLLIEGIQQLGIAFTYTYRGGAPEATIDARSIQVRALQLAPEFRKDYDNGLVTIRNPNVRAQKGKKPTGAGYIQINFRPITDPWSLPEKDKEQETAPSNATMFSKEERISEHREGDCLTPGFGCMKFLLELEIPVTETTYKQAYDPKVRGTQEKNVPETHIQKTCIDVNIAIDKRIPPDYIPGGLLRTLSKFLGSVIETIDKVLKPIETIGKYLFYTCVAGTFLSYVPILLEKYNCEFTSVLNAVSGEGKFDPNVAAIGACDEEYGEGTEEGDNCNSCQTWKEYRQTYRRYYRQICDRVNCPPAPSLQYYLKTKGRETPAAVNAPTAADALKSYTEETGKLLSGSDCAAWVDTNKRTLKGEKKTLLPPRLFFTTSEIEVIYQNWIEHQDDTAGEEETGLNCAGLHPATPKCCGFEYMQEWSSACGVSALGQTLDTFDEIKESTCLAEQQIGKNDIAIAGETTQCNKLLNSISGFCEKNGMPPLTTIKVAPISETEVERLELNKYSENNELYVVVQEKGGQSALGGIITTGVSQGYSINLGIIVRTIEFQKSDKPEALAISQRSRLTETLDVVQHPDYPDFQQNYFQQAQIDAFREKSAVPEGFKNTLCNAAGKGEAEAKKRVAEGFLGVKGVGGCNIEEKSIYSQVIAAIGTPDKEYIIRPRDGFVNSVRCICFPTIIGYLKLWSKIFGAIKSCFDTILYTGDGEAGVCQALVSTYVCDLLYDVLACFTQKFSTGEGRIGGEGAGGDIMGALVAAGSEMSRETEARYGESGMYKAVFVDRKLVHSICMFAFTGTWNFDLGAVFDQSIDEIPINSQALLTPCNKRFVAFNPSTRPGGLVTWVYHFGTFFAAGANADLELHLKCSNDYSCKQSDGFENGKCDCVGQPVPKTTIILPENLPSRVNKNQIVSEEVFYTMQSGSGASNLRYDKAFLLYRWKDGKENRELKTEPCSISLSGGPGTVPAFCRWDPFTVSYRCQFGEQPGGVRFKGHTITYSHKLEKKGDTFALGENLNFDLQIQQDFPGGEQYNKHLEYAVLDTGGKELATNKNLGLILLTLNGDYTKRIAADGTPTVPIEVRKDWFGAPEEAGKAFSIRQWSSKNRAAASENKIISDVSFTRQGVPVTTESRQFVVELTDKAGKTYYEIYPGYASTAIGQGTVQGQPGGFGYETQPIPGTGCSGQLQGSRISCAPQPYVSYISGYTPSSSESLTFTLKPEPTLPTADEIIQLHVNLGPQQTRTFCTGDVKGRDPQQFKIKFTAYDSDQYGAPTEQISVDPYTGEDAVYEISFNAICATKDEVKVLEGILGPQDILAGLSKEVGEMKGREETHKKIIEGFLLRKIDIAEVSNVNVALDAIITEETTNAGKLQQYVNNLQRMSIEAFAAAMVGFDLPNVMQDVTTKTNMLYNIIRPPTPAEIAATAITGTQITLQSNVVYRANDIKSKIAKQLTAEQMQDLLRGIVPVLQSAIAAKEELLKAIPAIAGAKGECPSGRQDPLETGDYYQCFTPADSPSGPYEEAKDKQCFGVQKSTCFKIPFESYCAGTGGKIKGKDRYACRNEPCAGNSYKTTNPVYCAVQGQTCCETKADTWQKLLTLMTDLQKNSDASKIKEFEDYQKLTNLQLLENHKVGIFGGRLAKIITEKETEQITSKGIYNALIEQNIKVPGEVGNFAIGTQGMPIGLLYYIEALKTTRNELVKLTPPTPDTIKAKLKEAQTTLELLEGVRKKAIAALEKELNLLPPVVAVVPKTVPELTINGKTDVTLKQDEVARVVFVIPQKDRDQIKENDVVSLMSSGEGHTSGVNIWTLGYRATDSIDITPGSEAKGDALPLKLKEGVYKLHVSYGLPGSIKESNVVKLKVTPPATIDPMFLSVAPCGGDYTAKGMFKDDDGEWAWDRFGVKRDAWEWLYLCVRNGILTKYGTDAVRLTPTTWCGAGYVQKGWFKNSITDWGVHDGNPMKDYDKITLCLKDNVPDIAYLGVQKTVISEGDPEGESYDEDVESYYCKDGYLWSGHFAFRHNQAEFAGGVYWPGIDQKIHPGYEHEAGSGGTGEGTVVLNGISDNWVMLCVKPVDASTLTAAPAAPPSGDGAAQSGAPVETKTINSPIRLAKACDTTTETSEGVFGDDDIVDWAFDFGGNRVSHYYKLNLCVKKELLAKYPNAARLIPTTLCGEGYVQKGWFKNDFDKWGSYDDGKKDMMKSDEITLCLNSAVKDIAYLGVESSVIVSNTNVEKLDYKYDCKDSEKKGYFNFKAAATPPSPDTFAGGLYWNGPTNPGWTLKYGTGTPGQSGATLQRETNNWVMLCVKPSITLT